MAKPKNTGLGRGLDAIFLDNETEIKSNAMLRLSDIEPRSDQPRKTFDQESLAQLAESIAANGLIQPIVVRARETTAIIRSSRANAAGAPLKWRG